MRIVEWAKAPIGAVACAGVGPGGKGRALGSIAVLSAAVEDLPEGLAGLVVTSDLQMVDSASKPVGKRRFLGEAVAQELRQRSDAGDLPGFESLGAILAGDFYVNPTLETRGGIGDVMGVWEAFDEAFGWVTGVAGNHDSFGGRTQRPPELLQGTARLLDGDVVELGGVRIGGVSGIVGSSGKPWRKAQDVYLSALKDVLEQAPDIVVLHESPLSPSRKHRGKGKSSLTRTILEHASATHPPLVVSGHVGWKEPMYAVKDGPQFLNVEERVVILTPQLLSPWS